MRQQECGAAITQGEHGGSENHKLPLGLQRHVQAGSTIGARAGENMHVPNSQGSRVMKSQTI